MNKTYNGFKYTCTCIMMIQRSDKAVEFHLSAIYQLKTKKKKTSLLSGKIIKKTDLSKRGHF